MEARLRDLQELERVLNGKYDMPIKHYEVVQEIEKLQKAIDFKNELKKDELLGRYSITKYFDLGVHFYNDKLNTFIYFKDEYSGVIYDDFIGSHSGMNEWAMVHVDNVYNFLTGNAPENYAIGTVTFKRVLKALSECEGVEECRNKLNQIIDYWESDDGKKVADAIDNTIDVAFKMVNQELIE